MSTRYPFPNNPSLAWQAGTLSFDGVSLAAIAEAAGTPTYVYSRARLLSNYARIRDGFAAAGIDARIHYSAKSNANLALLRALVEAGAGIDTVSGGEIFRALKAGASPADIVFAGVGKTEHDLRYAVAQGVGLFNIENIEEAALLDRVAAEAGVQVRAALRLNPGVAANTHQHIATGHGKAKFGLPPDAVRALLDSAARYPNLCFEGVHIHIGSQLGDTDATAEAVAAAVALCLPYPAVRTLDIGGGFPAAYRPDDEYPDPAAFAHAIAPLVAGFHIVLEPGRAIVADAGVLVTRVLYRKTMGGGQFVIFDAGMTDLIRPMLYEAHHEIVPVREGADREVATLVGPICETTDVFARDRETAVFRPGDLAAILTAGAYSMVMASNYNSRGRPAEVMVSDGGWHIVRARETWEDLIAGEVAAGQALASR
jgi:diaminopimelate decarboxylase